jgi:hypothetical protein
MRKKHLLLEATIAESVLLGTYRAFFLGTVRLGYLEERGSQQLLARQLISK